MLFPTLCLVITSHCLNALTFSLPQDLLPIRSLLRDESILPQSCKKMTLFFSSGASIFQCGCLCDALKAPCKGSQHLSQSESVIVGNTLSESNFSAHPLLALIMFLLSSSHRKKKSLSQYMYLRSRSRGQGLPEKSD